MDPCHWIAGSSRVEEARSAEVAGGLSRTPPSLMGSSFQGSIRALTQFRGVRQLNIQDAAYLHRPWFAGSLTGNQETSAWFGELYSDPPRSIAS